MGRSCAGSARRRNDDVPPLPPRPRRPQPPLPLPLLAVRLRRVEMSEQRIVEQSRRAPRRDSICPNCGKHDNIIDRLLAKAQDLIDQAWRTAQTKREVIALVDAYHDVRRARANLDLALTPQPVKYRPPSRSRLTP